MANKFYIKEGMEFEGIAMQEGKSNMPKIVAMLVGLLIVFGALGFGASKFLGSTSQPEEQKPAITILPTSSREITDVPEPSPTEGEDTPTPSPSPKQSPTPTKKGAPTVAPTATANARDLSLEVLNGSGTKGAARALSSALTDLGYDVVGTGNADAFTYKGITVNIKKSKSKALDQLKKDLSANDYLVSNSTTTLEESAKADAVVIVGSE